MEKNQIPLIKHVSQPAVHSVAEVVVHMVVGLVITIVVIHFVFPEISLAKNIHAAITVTGVKFIANYMIRRYFTGKSHKFRVIEDYDEE